MYFQINVTPKGQKVAAAEEDSPEVQAVLILAPFQPQPRLNIESTVGAQAETSLIVRNTSNRTLNVKISKPPPEDRHITLSAMELSIPPESDSNLSLFWTPLEPGSWRDTLQLTDNRRLKYDIPLTTTCLGSKKPPKTLKPKSQRILTASNDNNSRKIQAQPRKVPQKLPENKENFTIKRQTSSAFSFSSKPKNPIFDASHSKNYETSHSNYQNICKIEEKSHADLNMSGVFNISNFQLTPLKMEPKTSGHTEKPEDKNVMNFEFSPRDPKIISPAYHPETLPLRRETYFNPDPKFCKLPPLDPLNDDEQYEENFHDSLSPRPDAEENPANFSALINNLACFTTPQKTDYPPQNRGLTVTKKITKEVTFATVSNDTFEISDSRIETRQQSETLNMFPGGAEGTDYLASIKEELSSYPEEEIYQSGSNFHQYSQRSETDVFLHPTRLLKTLDQLSPVARDLSRKSLPISSSPLPTLRTTDSASVQQVIEADLWLKDEPESTPLRHQKSISLESIPEEPSFRHQSTFPQLNLTKTFTSPLKPTVFEISPTKKPSRNSRQTLFHKISPTKPSKIMKDRVKENGLILKKTKLHLTQKSIPGVRISKLSLSKLQKSQKEPQRHKEQSIKLHNPNDLLANVFNPDPFAATMTEDPFLASTLYYDEKWMWNQEQEFKKWLNALLTPPEHLSADVDTVKVDVGKVWQSCRGKDTITLAETREAVSARYHTNHRLNTLRKAAMVMFNRSDVRTALAKTIISVEKGNLVVRQDKDLHRDIGLQKEILELFFSYNPLWLRIGLEVIYGETIPLASNNDLVGLTKFLLNRFFSDPFLSEKFSHQNSTLKTPNFMPNLNKFILKKLLLLVYFLDYAKRNKLIGHDPCLFHKKAIYKESREILLNFSRQTLSGVGDITKMLRPHGYVVSHKQTYLDEYDYAVKDLSVDLRDGVRLCRVMELMIGGENLTGKCRVPAISRLQKVHNADLALVALRQAGYVITGEIDAKAVADGHREKTLSLLWQIIYKFQAPRFEKAAKILQKWWRANLHYILVRNYLRNRKFNAAVVIQCCWRSYRARKIAESLRNQKIAELRRKNLAARIIQTRWRSLKDRRTFLRTKHAVMILQKTWRRYRTSKPYLEELQRKKQAAITIQRYFKSYKVMQIERSNFLGTLGACLIIQRWYRAICQGQRTFADYQKLKRLTISVQRRFRANKLMKTEKQNYGRVIKSINVIQSWWRSVLLTKSIRNNFIIKKHSVKVISDWFINTKLMKNERRDFLEQKHSSIVIQRAFRRFRETRGERKYLKNVMRSSVVLQTWWRTVRAQREFQLKRKSISIIQNWYRSAKLTRQLSSEYIQLKASAILLQKNFRMKRDRKRYLMLKTSVLTVEHWYSNIKTGKSIRNDYLKKRDAVVRLQEWYRGVTTTKSRRNEFLNLKKSTIYIQRIWRSKMLMRTIKHEFSNLKQTVIRLQAIARGHLARRKFLTLQQRQHAAVVLQRRWRARKLGLVTRHFYLKQKNAVVCIQRRFRANLLARRQQDDYQNLRNAVISVQRRFRAQKLMQAARKLYLTEKRSAVLLQSIWKMKRCLRQYKITRRAINVIQTRWRATMQCRQLQTTYSNLKRSTITIQRRFRANLESKKCRTRFLKLKSSIITIQRTWRSELNTRKQNNAAVVLQAWWRSIASSRRQEKLFQAQKRSAITIQRRFRGYRLTKSAQHEFRTLKNSTRIIQRSWRVFSARRRRRELMKLQKKSVLAIENWWRLVKVERQQLEEQRAVLRRQMWAAEVIQAAWRGHRVREEQSARIKELRERSKQAARAAVPSTTVAYRLQEAMNGLINFSNVGQLNMCLTCIDTLTRLSIKGCIMFCDLDLVEKIYDLLEQSNRSLPWMDVCLRCTNILITLAKLPDTAGRVRRLEYMETVARLMNVTVKGQSELFLNLATLMWVLMGHEEFAEAVRNDQRTVWLLKSACNVAVKKEGRVTPVKRKNTSMERIIVLPNVKPDWGLATRRPRCFIRAEHAVYALMEVFGMQSLGF